MVLKLNGTGVKFDLKSGVKNSVKFDYYRKGHLYYKAIDDNGTVITFPVPIDDIGDATFMDIDKGILFMRYIHKHLQTLDGNIFRNITTNDL